MQELVSRLTQTRISEFNSSVNKTIVTSDIWFPLDQPIYVDATHDNVMANSTWINRPFLNSMASHSIYAVVTALNLTSLASSGPLPTDYIPEGRVSRFHIS